MQFYSNEKPKHKPDLSMIGQSLVCLDARHMLYCIAYNVVWKHGLNINVDRGKKPIAA